MTTEQNKSPPQHTSGPVEFWHIGNGKFVARDHYHSAEFTPNPDDGYLEVRAKAHANLARARGQQ